MAAALEELCSREVINHDEAIKALKKENETLEAEKARLAEDVPALRQEVVALKKEKEDLELEATNLQKNVSKAETTRDTAVQRAEKADEISRCLCEELEAEWRSTSVMQSWLKDAHEQTTAVVGLYSNALSQFGGSTSAPPRCGDVGVSLAWLRSHVSKLPDFVGGAVDVGALVAVSSFDRLLCRDEFSHIEALQKEIFSSVVDVGDATSSLGRSVWNFFGSFWARFVWSEARSIVEARRAEVL
jgi:hypothetical protein